MSVWLVLMSLVAAVNPPRVAASLSATPRGERIVPLARGVAVASVVLVAVGTLGGFILDVLDLTDETWRIAAGAVAVLVGARHLSIRSAVPVPALTSAIHAVAPVAFPLLLVPEVLVLVILYGATESAGLWLVGIALAMASLLVWGHRDDGPVNRGLVRALAALLIVAGIALLVAGIRDV